MARRLGWIGPAIVLVGIAGAIAMTWFWRASEPVPGDTIDELDCAGGKLVVRAERGGDRAFVEMHAGNELKWQGLIPHYPGSRGRPAVACGSDVVTVRVERGGRAEVFGFAVASGQKAGGYRLATEHEPIHVEPTGPITLTDHRRSYEIVGGAGWHQLIAVDLSSGEGVWKADLGPDPVTDGGLHDARVWIRQGARERTFDPETGRESPVTRSDN
jgi:hypothetical protein